MDIRTLRSKISLFLSSFKRKNVIISLVSTVFVLSALVVGVIYVRQRQGILPVGATGVELQLVTVSTTVNKDDEFNVDVYIDTKGMSVTGTDINVKYDSNQLLAESIQKGDFLPVIFIPGQITSGLAKIVLGCDVTAPKNGNGILATVKFKALGQGTSTTISFDPAPATAVAALGQTTDVSGTLPTLNITIAALPTPIDGDWSDWSPASCPTACDLPASSQTRTCTNPTPANGGADCVGLATSACAATGSCLCAEPATETQNLNCPDGYSGSIAQIRTKSAYPACAWGDWVTTSDTCALVNTPVDGGWSGWNPTSCPTDCGLAESTQTRMCNNPAPTYGGADCSLLDGGSSTSSCSATAACVTPTPTATPTGSAKVGDVNGDGTVNILDIGEIINNYDKTGDDGFIRSDLNNDGIINILDIGIVINNYDH